MRRTAAVFFDVDFTLIHPGPRFQGEGYHATCVRHGLTVDAARFDEAVAGAAPVLESPEHMYEASLYINYTRRIIELMGGTGAGVERAAQEIYDEWADHHHFVLYDDVEPVLRELRQRGMRLGLISNSHRPLESFRSHFELEDLISVAVSSHQHGFLKPHPLIFQAALSQMGVTAAESAMVGDSLTQDVMGARGAGMHGILIARGDRRETPEDVPVIRSLRELVTLI